MKRTVTSGVCQLCQEVVGKAAMTRHLTKCLAAHAPPGKVAAKAPPRKGTLFQVVVQGKYNPQYWLQVEMSGTATLAQLDGFLRHLWLECCGHLSAFTIQGTMYSVGAGDGDLAPFDMDERDMNVPVGKVFHMGLKCTHEYDFGSTTTLDLKVVGEREGTAPAKDPVRLLARNVAPVLPCDKCGKPADWVSTEEEEAVCKKCAKGEEEEGFLPVVNSPRVGVCGYTG